MALIWKITKLLSVKHTCPEFKFCTRRFGFMQIWFCMNCWLYVEKHLNGLQTEALDDMWKNTWMGYKLGHLMICGKTLEWATNWATSWYVEIHLNGLQTGALEACFLTKMCRIQCINFFNIPYTSICFLKKTIHCTISSLKVIWKFLKCRINKQKCEIWQGKLIFFPFLFKKE